MSRSEVRGVGGGARSRLPLQGRSSSLRPPTLAVHREERAATNRSNGEAADLTTVLLLGLRRMGTAHRDWRY